MTDSEEIIEQIQDIYEMFDIPQNLRMHMMRAAGVCKIICDNWKGPKINKDDAVATALIHDLGNIVKFDLDSLNATQFMVPEDAKRLDHWKELKEEVIQKYGRDDHEATINMAKEAGASDRILEILHKFVLLNNEKIFKENDWETKICNYADQRVAPTGIVTLHQRWFDLKKRYKGKVDISDELAERLQIAGEDIERQLFKNVNATKLKGPEAINDQSIEKYINFFEGM